MTSWLQSSDFKHVDLDHLGNTELFKSLIQNFDFDKLDKQMIQLIDAKDEYCPWGIGVNMDSDYGLHFMREDPKSNTYSVQITDIIKRKVLGFIPSSSDEGAFHEGLSLEQALDKVSEYYSGLENRLA